MIVEVFRHLSWVSPNPEWAKWAAAGFLVMAAAWVGRVEKELLRAALLLIAASLLLAPTLHPWYFVWVIPFLCLYPARAFLVWNSTIVFAYTVWPRFLRYHVWDLHPAIQLLEYAPVYGLLIYDYYGHRSRAE